MEGETIQLLLVEDDLGFAALLDEWLGDLSGRPAAILPFRIFVTQVNNLSQALKTMEDTGFDILLVDLNLPDSVGLETFERIRDLEVACPVIVLSGLDDELLAIQAVRSGAQDYLVKNTIDGNLLFRSIRYALERHALHQELEQAREQDRRLREQGALDRLSDRNVSSIAARMLGIQELKGGYPDRFARIVAQLAEILDKLLQMRTHKIVFNISDDLKRIAAELFVLRCGPRDVVDIYLATLESRETPGNPIKNEAVHEECRYLAFELMGRLVSFYRPYALGGDG
ncbi:MAG: response regulator [Magnetococcales bacterium]|nr:response regulator [Magnetococcales bacterium]